MTLLQQQFSFKEQIQELFLVKYFDNLIHYLEKNKAGVLLWLWYYKNRYCKLNVSDIMRYYKNNFKRWMGAGFTSHPIITLMGGHAQSIHPRRATEKYGAPIVVMIEFNPTWPGAGWWFWQMATPIICWPRWPRQYSDMWLTETN